MVVRLSLTGLGVALAMSAAISFVPLYAQEEVGVSPSTAGVIAAFMGLAGVSGRVFWSVVGGRSHQPVRVLVGIAVMAIAGLALIIASGTSTPWLIWPAALSVGFSLLAWHAVAWLSVIHTSGVGYVGRVSGVVQVGNSMGFAGGPLLMGILVDTTHSYLLAWLSVTALMILVTITLARPRSIGDVREVTVSSS
jgi:cyanate permease